MAHEADHPSSVQIISYACDRLASTEGERVHGHCLVCDECGARLEALLCLRHAARRPVPAAVRWSAPLVGGGLTN